MKGSDWFIAVVFIECTVWFPILITRKDNLPRPQKVTAGFDHRYFSQFALLIFFQNRQKKKLKLLSPFDSDSFNVCFV